MKTSKIQYIEQDGRLVRVIVPDVDRPRWSRLAWKTIAINDLNNTTTIQSEFDTVGLARLFCDALRGRSVMRGIVS